MLNAYHLHLLKMLAASIFFTALSMSSPAVAEEYWKSVSAGWKISCGVDRGSIVRQSGTTYVFKTSSNKCSSRGTYSQRAELSGLYFSARNKVSYQFSSTVQMETKSREQFTIFQVHDGRGSCAPPLKLHWTRHDTLVFYSAYSLDKGAHDCVENASLVKQRYTGPRLKRDGTAYELKVMMDFDGFGGFHTTVFVNGRKSLSGTYTMCQLFLDIYKAVGLKDASSHSGRRTYITRLANKGVSVRLLAELAGHSHISTTQRYIDVNAEQLANAVELL